MAWWEDTIKKRKKQIDEAAGDAGNEGKEIYDEFSDELKKEKKKKKDDESSGFSLRKAYGRIRGK